MAKASIMILRQNQDGIHAEVFHWDALNAGELPPPGIPSIAVSITKFARVQADFNADRLATTRAALKTIFAAYVDAKFPETSA